MIKKLIILLISLTIVKGGFANSLITLTDKNFVNLYGEITGQLVTTTILSLENSKSSETYLYINSPGGSVLDGLVLVNYLQHTDKKIICIVEYAASMAHAILQACPIRYGTMANILLQHKPSATASGSPSEIRGTLNILEGLENTIGLLESRRIGITLTEFKQKTFLPWVTFGQESLIQNRLDNIVEVICTPELYQKFTKKQVNSLFTRGTVTFSACPLLSPLFTEEEER